MRLENVVESRDLKVSNLDDNMITSIEINQFKSSCLNCYYEPNQENDFLEHNTNENDI